MQEKVELPRAKTKRDGILYAKVKPGNKQFLKKLVRGAGHTVSSYVDEWLDNLRANASNRPKRSNRRNSKA